MSNVGRNDPCPCGSGKKYKQCCLAKQSAKPKGFAGRKFTAKVLNNASASEENSEKQAIAPVDYNLLMEKTFKGALEKFPDAPPIPENPDMYLSEEEQNKK